MEQNELIYLNTYSTSLLFITVLHPTKLYPLRAGFSLVTLFDDTEVQENIVVEVCDGETKVFDKLIENQGKFPPQMCQPRPKKK